MASPTHLARRIARGAIAVAAGFFALAATAAPWTPTGPADGGQAPAYGAVATHPLIGGRAMIVAGFIPSIAQTATYATVDGGAHWNANARHGGFGRPLLGGTPSIAYLDQGGSVLRSPDDGRTWAPIVLPAAPAGTAVLLWAVNPGDGAELVVAAGNQVSRSIDAGGTWTTDTAPGAVSFLDVDWSTRTIYAAFAPGQPVGHRPLDTLGAWGVGGADPAVLAAGHGVALYQNSAKALFRSIDGGVTFLPVAAVPAALALCDLAFASAPSSRVYGLECTSRRILRSENDGAGFVVVGLLPSGTVAASIAVDAANPSKVYVATSGGVLESTNGGASFAPLARSTGAPGRGRLLFLDAKSTTNRYLTDLPTVGAGYASSHDGGLTWSESASGRRLLGASRDRAGVVFGAFGDPQGGDAEFSVSTDAGATWNHKINAHGPSTVFGPIAYGPAVGQIFLYAASPNPLGLDARIYVSADDGDSWAERTGPPVAVRAIAVTNTLPPTIFIGGAALTPGAPQLFSSTDAVNWTPVATFPSPLSAFGGTSGNEITALVIDPVVPERMWAAFRYPDYVMRSDDSGETWAGRTSGLGAGEITSLEPDRDDPAGLYATQLGGGIFRSPNRGDTWAALDDGLHEDVVLRMDFDRFVANRIYVSTGSGVMQTDISVGYPSGGRRAIEFYHHDFNHYFVSADAPEIAGLDDGTIAGWTRTGEGFRIAEEGTAGNQPVCRFFGIGFAPLSSHFYTPYPSECESLKTNPAWFYERIAFGLAIPDPPPERGCPPGTRVLYRLFNALQGGAPNHRLTTSAATMAAMLGMGWTFEGEVPTLVSACVPY